jgi:putative phage-type endonuclease
MFKQQIDALQLILDNVTLPINADNSDDNLIKEREEEELIETLSGIINDLIISDPTQYTNPKFHEKIVEEVEEVAIEQLNHLYKMDDEDFLEELAGIIEKAMNLFYRHVAPRRSYPTTFIRTKPNIEIMRKKIEYLQAIPQPDQRTTEWYHFRHKFLTASSIWKAFGTPGSKNQLIYDKCSPINVDKYKSVSTETAMHWGNKYEQVSVEIYERDYKTKVSDFGCLPHKTIPFIAASPDGINTLETSDRYGRMLEVKNIVNREINGIPKLEYWIQMQVQMEVCNLNECDFLETRFTEYESVEEFEADGTFTLANDGLQKGIIMYFNKNGQPLYEYAPLDLSPEEFTIWEESIMEKHADITWMKNIYWKLAELSCVLVLRNKLWFKSAEPILNEFWKTIEHEKINGYEHRAPNKKIKNSNKELSFNEIGNNEIYKNKCLINVTKLFNVDESIVENEHTLGEEQHVEEQHVEEHIVLDE